MSPTPLQPGDTGYVSPVEAPSTLGLTPEQELAEAEERIAEEPETTPEPQAEPDAPVEEVPASSPTSTLTSAQAGALHAQGVRTYETKEVTQASYDQLLSAYTALKHRVGLDPSLEKQLDTQAGLVPPAPVVEKTPIQ